MAKKKTTQSSAAKSGQKPKPSAGAQKKTKKKSTAAPKTDPRQRLQRFMASAGVASRRECEIIIEEGRVHVDGEIVVKLGTKIDPTKQIVFVDGQRIIVQDLQYFVLNKPSGIVSTSNDPSGRPRVIDLIDTDKRVYNVGRLDQSSEGLILVTNDGELANQLTHPRFGVEKKYHVLVDGIPAYSALRQLEEGIYIAEGKVRASHIKFMKKAKNGSWLEIILTEGRNREIRRMLSTIGHKVRTLKRVAIGPLRLGDLPKGAHRPLTSTELKALKRAASGEARAKRQKSTKKKSKGRSATATTTTRRTAKPTTDRKSSASATSRRPSASGSRGASKGTKTSKGKPVRSKTPRKKSVRKTRKPS